MTKQSFKQFIQESPIGEYQTIGDFKKRASFFDKRDRMLVTHPASITRTKKKFGATEHLFNFYFVNSKEAKENEVTELGLVTLERLRDLLGDEVHDAVSKTMGDDAINVVFTGNSGAERKNLTAWMMAHRIGHAMNRTRQKNGYKEAADYLISQFAACMGYYGRDEFPDTERKMTYSPSYGGQDDLRVKQKAMKEFFHHVGGFRSAREGIIRDWFEVLNELIAQYLTTGKIKFRPAPQTFGKKGFGSNRGFNHRIQDEQGLEEVNDLLDTLGRDMTYHIDNMLSAVCNEVLIM